MLPASRNTTYAALSQVKSFDLNDLQDQIIALAAAKTIELAPGAACQTRWFTSGSTGWFASVGTEGWLESVDVAGGVEAQFFLPVVPGMKLHGYTIGYSQSVSSALAVIAQLYRYDPVTNTRTQLGTTQTSLAQTAYQLLTETLGTPHTVVAGERHFIMVTSGNTTAGTRTVRRVAFNRSRVSL